MIINSAFNRKTFVLHRPKAAVLKSISLLVLIMGFSSFLFAQIKLPENKIAHYEGSMGPQKNMILDLQKFGDSIYGTFYNQLDGKLHYYSGKTNHSVQFEAVEKNGDSLIGQFLTAYKVGGYTCDGKGKNKREFSFTETDYFGSFLFSGFRNSITYSFSDKPLFPTYKVDLLYLVPEGNVNKAVEDSVQDYIIGYYFGQKIEFNSSENLLKLLSDKYYQNYFGHYKTNAFDYRSSLLKWSALQDIQIMFNENFVLSFCLKQNTLNWLPEPIWDKLYFVINLKTGNRITANEIFTAGYKEKLRNLLTEKLKKQFNISNSLTSEGFYRPTVNKFDNIFISREGVGFHYNPGDLGPWCFGEIDISFSFDELKEILLTKGIVYTLVQ